MSEKEIIMDLSLLDNYEIGMKLKDKRGSIWEVEFIGNVEITIINVKTGNDKNVFVTNLNKYEIME